MGIRRQARIIAFQALYAWDQSGKSVENLTDFPWLDDDKRKGYPEESLTFARLLVQGFLENYADIDEKIRAHLDNWDISRLARVDLALLRLGCYSLLYQSQIPATVTIDEAIDIGKKYGSDDSYRFINGVLDGIRKSIE
jgi:transcription antitermination protein NusB